MSSREELRNQLGEYLKYMKMSGVEFLPAAAGGKKAPMVVSDGNHAGPLEDMTFPAPSSTGDRSASDQLFDILTELGDCQRCRLGKTRTNLVFGAGNPEADLLFVGEAPGGDEDLQGEPFVGKAGQLLTRIIEAIDIKRDDVYICNIIKCRPPENRNPLPEEIEPCEPFLTRQIRAIRPKVICALGKFAAQTLLNTEAPISTLRGRFHDYHGIPLMPTYHPAFLLRNPSMKRPVWEDMKLIKKRLKGED